jgi:MotA/TolQ/ExbB proton channel family
VRRTLVQYVLPLNFCLVPLLAGLLIAVAIPSTAREYYQERITDSPMDWLILGLGIVLFLVQMVLSWRALQWRATGFDERPDRWLSYLAQAAEWFPLLGLLGTVAGILQTFVSIRGPEPPATIIRLYAPAITATGSGLFMALINILPTWVVLLGRELILALGGGEASSVEELPP